MCPYRTRKFHTQPRPLQTAKPRCRPKRWASLQRGPWLMAPAWSMRLFAATIPEAAHMACSNFSVKPLSHEFKTHQTEYNKWTTAWQGKSFGNGKGGLNWFLVFVSLNFIPHEGGRNTDRRVRSKLLCRTTITRFICITWSDSTGRIISHPSERQSEHVPPASQCATRRVRELRNFGQHGFHNWGQSWLTVEPKCSQFRQRNWEDKSTVRAKRPI